MSENSRVTAEQLKRAMDIQTAQVEEQATSAEGDLKVEREWRISLQNINQQDRERISKLQIEIGQLKIIAQVFNVFHFVKLTFNSKIFFKEIRNASGGLLHVEGTMPGTGAHFRGVGSAIA